MTPGEVQDVLIEAGALLEGHFELRSGLHSNRFFQCANVLRYPRMAAQLCDALVAKMARGLGDDVLNVDGVIAPALGGIVVGHEVARALADKTGRRDVKSIFAEKEEGRLVLRRFTIQPGERYVVAEDVVTRGGRVQETVDIVTGAGADVAAIGLLVNRSGGKASFDAPMVSLLEIEPVTWEPRHCPLCEEGKVLVHPGS
jgi:orotate phosphoribosyltransferase